MKARVASAHAGVRRLSPDLNKKATLWTYMA